VENLSAPATDMTTGEKIEWAAILVATASLIPWAFGYRQFWYRGILMLSLAAMVVVAVRRLRRVKHMHD
jgi:hypothetical protein